MATYRAVPSLISESFWQLQRDHRPRPGVHSQEPHYPPPRLRGTEHPRVPSHVAIDGDLLVGDCCSVLGHVPGEGGHVGGLEAGEAFNVAKSELSLVEEP